MVKSQARKGVGQANPNTIASRHDGRGWQSIGIYFSQQEAKSGKLCGHPVLPLSNTKCLHCCLEFPLPHLEIHTIESEPFLQVLGDNLYLSPSFS